MWGDSKQPLSTIFVPQYIKPQYRDILKLEPVQERITQIHQAQEQQRQKEKALEALQGWKQMAIKLGRPQTYVQRIQAITEEYRRGKPLNENQHERMKQDLTAYQEQLRQAQAQQQKQRSPRMGRVQFVRLTIKALYFKTFSHILISTHFSFQSAILPNSKLIPSNSVIQHSV